MRLMAMILYAFAVETYFIVFEVIYDFSRLSVDSQQIFKNFALVNIIEVQK